MGQARSKRPRTAEDESASRCPARTAWSIPMNRMKVSVAVARLPCGATTAPAREARGGQETGTAQPAMLAQRRERHPGLSDYPTDAQSTRRSTYSLWSSSPFPRPLI